VKKKDFISNSHWNIGIVLQVKVIYFFLSLHFVSAALHCPYQTGSLPPLDTFHTFSTLVSLQNSSLVIPAPQKRVRACTTLPPNPATDIKMCMDPPL